MVAHGMISQYNLEKPYGLQNIKNEKVTVVEEMAGNITHGKVTVVEDVVDGILESAPAALVGLFSGRNLGKQAVAIARA